MEAAWRSDAQGLTLDNCWRKEHFRILKIFATTGKKKSFRKALLYALSEDVLQNSKLT